MQPTLVNRTTQQVLLTLSCKIQVLRNKLRNRRMPVNVSVHQRTLTHPSLTAIVPLAPKIKIFILYTYYSVKPFITVIIITLFCRNNKRLISEKKMNKQTRLFAPKTKNIKTKPTNRQNQSILYDNHKIYNSTEHRWATANTAPPTQNPTFNS